MEDVYKRQTLLWLKRLVPNLRLSQLNRISYQQLLNDYAEFHERQTTMAVSYTHLDVYKRQGYSYDTKERYIILTKESLWGQNWAKRDVCTYTKFTNFVIL